MRATEWDAWQRRWGCFAAKRHGQTDGDGRDVRVHGVLERATCADYGKLRHLLVVGRQYGPRFDAHGRNASWAPVLGGRRSPTALRCTTASADWVPDFGGEAAGVRRRAGHGGAGGAFAGIGAAPGSVELVGRGAGSRSVHPAAVRREVWRRDEGCCSYVDPHSGRRCGSRYRLEIDHIVPFALGGGAEPGDLRLRVKRTTGCATLTPRVCRLMPGALRSPRSTIPGNAGGPPHRMRQSIGPGRDRAVVVA